MKKNNIKKMLKNPLFWILIFLSYILFFPEVYTSSVYWSKYNKYYLIKNKLGIVGFIDYNIELKLTVYFIIIPFTDKLFSFQKNPFGNFRIYNKSDFQQFYKMFGV